MKGCAGAGGTQARTLTCMSPPPLALHPRFALHGFRVLLNSDGAPVFLLFFAPVWWVQGLGRVWLEASCVFLRLRSARFGFGSYSRPLVSLCFLHVFSHGALAGVRRALNHLDKAGARFGSGSDSRPLLFRWSLGWNLNECICLR